VPIRVFIADDHPFVRRGLRGFLEGEPEIDVVGEAADGEDAVALVLRTAPDIASMDLAMPGDGGIDATRRITAEHPEVRVIVLTSFGSTDDIVPAIAAGASGHVLKDVEPGDGHLLLP
jgi:DNA-binding NarL/FixJ family response regulator